ncbi:MAG TPA: PQQ-dependent sugar dehydrogenase [Actinomycetales bacterium]
MPWSLRNRSVSAALATAAVLTPLLTSSGAPAQAVQRPAAVSATTTVTPSVTAAAVLPTAVACTTPICGVTRVATENDIPWGLATLPDGSVLYTRRDAHDVVRLDPRTGRRTRAGVVPGARSTGGEGGLLGLAIAPTFARDPWVYLMHTTAGDNRIVRMRYAAGKLVPSTTQVLVKGILRSRFHNGGRLRFGPDGMLYAATGDASVDGYAQVLSGRGSLNGKILRMTPTGAVPPGNPFGTLVWSYGHRNPQGLAFDARGRLWEQEFGNDVMDETNLVVRGGNHGWPQCEGTSSRSGSGCRARGLVAPKRTYPTAIGSCSGLTIVREAVYVACTRGTRLYRGVITGSSLTGVRPYLVGTDGRLRTVEPAPGGLWLTTSNDRDSRPGNSAERILRVRLR